MATVHELRAYRKPQAVTHYAIYRDTNGTAELLNGSGYLFRQEGQRKATVVSYKNPELVMLGRCDLADTQYIADLAAGGAAAIACSRDEGRS